MKLRITFKDPDAFYEAIEDKRREISDTLMTEMKLSKVGADTEAEERMKAFDDLFYKYFVYGEYLTVELDSEKQTIRVMDRTE